MDYQNSTIGFAAKLSSTGTGNDQKPSIGFAAEFKKGMGTRQHEPSIGFTAKLREPAKPHPQLSFDF